MKPLAQKTFVVLSVALCFAALIYFVFLIGGVLFDVVLGLFFALALEPLVRRFIKMGVKRGIAAALALTLTFIAFTLLISAVAGPFITESRNLIENAPEILDKIRQHPTFGSWDEKYQLTERGKAFVQELPAKLQQGAFPVTGFLTGVLGSISTLAIVLVLAFFMLLEGPELWNSFLSLFPSENEVKARGIAAKMSEAVSGYVSGNLFISFIAGVVALITLSIAGVPYAVALAVLVATLDLIPNVGATLATILVGLVALTQGPLTAGIVVGVMLVYQTVENNVIQPIVYSKTNALSPLLIIIATLIGVQLGGIVGALLAIPAASIAQIAFLEILSLNKKAV